MATPIMTDLGGITIFDCHGDQTNIGSRWEKWRRSFELFVEGKGVTDINQKKALLLHCGGSQMQDIFYTFTNVPAPNNDNNAYDIALRLLDEHFSPQVNVPFERHLFRNMTQQQGETIDQFITRLRQKVEYCEFANNDEQIRDQVIEKCLSHHLRRKLLEKGKDLTLKQLQETARAMENSESQANRIETASGTRESVSVNRVHHSKRTDDTRCDKRQTDTSGKQCFRCGSENHLQNSKDCPALGKECYKCHNIGHFSKRCKTKPAKGKNRQTTKRNTHGPQRVKLVSGEQDNDDYAFTFMSKYEDTTVNVEIGGISNIPMIIDSGATCNVIDQQLWESLKSKRVECESKKVEKNLYPYGCSKPLQVIGSFRTNLVVGGKSVVTDVDVIKGEGPALLGKSTAIHLGVLKIGPSVKQVSADEPSQSLNTKSQSLNTKGSEQDMFEKYKHCFEGIGKLKDFQLEIPIDESVRPVAQQVRRIPFNLRDKLEMKLGELEKLDIIEKTEGPTPWVSPVVVIPKENNDIRLCVDMRRANEAIIRERHPIPTVEEVLYDLNRSTVFSKLDIKWAFHQIELSEQSRSITTFVTHKGLYRYKRLMFGISCAPEMYQRVVQQTLEGCEGVRNLFDDIIVHGKTVEEHDKRLENLLQRISETGMTLNPLTPRANFEIDVL